MPDNRIFQEHVWLQNMRPISNPYYAAACLEFYGMLIHGTAVERVDPNAPPLAIERDKGGNI